MRLNQSLVLVRVDPPKEQDDSGIYIQEEWITHQPIGTVEAVAFGVTFCKVGDRVLFERYTSIPTHTDKDLRLCREDAILAVLDA